MSVLTLGSLLVLPGPSIDFWTRLALGNTGLGQSLIYYTNQSVMANVVRILEPGRTSALIGLGLSRSRVGGVWAAMLWHRLGEIGLAVTLCGIAGLLASSVSWCTTSSGLCRWLCVLLAVTLIGGAFGCQ